MHAEVKAAEDFDSTHEPVDAPEETVTLNPAHSLLAVLLPATPPTPKNARVIRLFDLEAAKYDPRPGETAPVAAAAPAPTVKKESSRSALREERSKSLLAAARYF